MKRILSMTLAVLLIAAALPFRASAAGKLTIQQMISVITEDYAYGYAIVENTGDKPAEYTSGLFEVYDADGNLVLSDTYPHMLGQVLQPGEYAYVECWESFDEEEDAVRAEDFDISVSGKSAQGTRTERLLCETEWCPEYPVSKYWTEDRMVATFTNTTDQVLYEIKVAFALLNESGKLLYVDSQNLSSRVGLWPGSTVTVYQVVSSDVMEVLKDQGEKPTLVDAYAYIDYDD